MMEWVLIGELFGVLARATNRPGVRPDIPKYLDMLAAIVERGGVAKEELVALKAHINQMVAEDREPTQEEWDTLRGRSDDAHATIQNADLSEEEDDPEPPAAA